MNENPVKWQDKEGLQCSSVSRQEWLASW